MTCADNVSVNDIQPRRSIRHTIKLLQRGTASPFIVLLLFNDATILDDKIHDSQSLVYSRMSFGDFAKNFTRLEICQIGTGCFGETSSKKRWEEMMERGSWKKYVNAGGCGNHKGFNSDQN
jgi:hypothetical protein